LRARAATAQAQLVRVDTGLSRIPSLVASCTCLVGVRSR
jgi:hypothetical protein